LNTLKWKGNKFVLDNQNAAIWGYQVQIWIVSK
jgi:hypothetical protein